MTVPFGPYGGNVYFETVGCPSNLVGSFFTSVIANCGTDLTAQTNKLPWGSASYICNDYVPSCAYNKEKGLCGGGFASVSGIADSCVTFPTDSE